MADFESSAPEVQHWRPDQPDGDDGENCAFFSVSTSDPLSGFWQDADCNDFGYYAVCEKYSLVAPNTTEAFASGGTTVNNPTTVSTATTATGGSTAATDSIGTTDGGTTTSTTTTATPTTGPPIAKSTTSAPEAEIP